MSTSSTGYPKFEELVQVAGEMVRRHPEVFRLRRAGGSRGGAPLLVLSVGEGSRNILSVAGAHANEPVGGLTSLRLARLLGAREDLWRALDCTWHFLLCLDPDGSRLNEEWFSPLPTPRAYFRGFHRPLFAHQPEFPPAPGDSRRPLPESECLLALLDELRPILQFTLHGSEMGGAFVQTTRAIPGIAPVLRAAAAELRIPVDLRPFDGIDWYAAGPGVLTLPGPGTRRERDPSGLASGSTWLYPAPHGTVTAILEAPTWAVDAVADPAPCPDPERAVARAGETLVRRVGHVAGLLSLAGERPATDPHAAAALELLTVSPGVVDTWLHPGFRYADGTRPATTRGNAAALLIAVRRIALRAAAMLARSLRAAPAGDADAAKARTTLEDLVDDWCAELEAEFSPRPVPVADQAALQTRLALACARLTTAGHGKP